MTTTSLRSCGVGLVLLLGGCSSDSTGTKGPPGTLGSDSGAHPTSEKPPCLAKPSQVVALGDSYVAAPVVLIPKVAQLAVTDGALAQGDTYRDYSVPGTTVDTPVGAGTIPPQWTAAKQADADIKAVIMDGGGNDILASLTFIGAGADKDPMCTGIVDRVTGVISSLMMDMQSAGVADVIFFLYPNVPGGGKDILGYSVNTAQVLATAATTDSFRVHIVDPRSAFDGHPEYFGADPIHANPTGAQRLAELLSDEVKSTCRAQPASSGGCTP